MILSVSSNSESPITRIVAVTNQKGGVGKTTTTINLAASLARRNKRVLLVDLDPQGNASTGLGIEYDQRNVGTYAALMQEAAPADLPQETQFENLSIITANNELAGAEIEMIADERREYRLRDALRALEGQYDIILIDCPPSLGLLTLNALVASDSVLVPLQCEFFALEGISQLVRTIDRVRRAFNADLHLEGIILTMYDRRNNLSELVAQDARGFFGEQVFETIIPRNIRISEAQSHGTPVLDYDARSTGAAAYLALADELLTKTGNGKKA
ncbi:chromosome partitioning protein ParA [Gluconobacter wancherniae NBRC 103581]|nr:chromosome partitioning protein ParA [Gluconobacter wancherniae NBRC 103581]